MALQVIGRKACKDTQKALRFFKERGLSPQYVDLDQRALSPGELENIFQHVPPEEAIDETSKQFKRRNLAYLSYDPREELEEDQGLLRTPVVRYKGKAVAGYEPERWKDWAEQAKEG
jgi:arsenate reductase (glutaredoxin)